MSGTSDSINFVKGITLGIICILMASIAAAAGKHVSQWVDSSTIVFSQYLICLFCSLPWLIRQGVGELKTRYVKYHLIRGVSGCVCFYTYYLAIKYIPLVDASLLRNSAPLVVPLVLLAGLGVAIPRYRWLPIIIGFAGIVLILKPDVEGLNVWHLVGFSSGVGLAISMVSTRLLATREPEQRILFYYFLISLLSITPFYYYQYQPMPLSALPWLLYIGFSTYFSLGLYTRAYSYVKSSVLAPTTYFGVVFAGILDWLFWDQLPDMLTVAGIVLVISGGLLMIKLGDT